MHESSNEGVSRVYRERTADDSQLTQIVEAGSCNVVDVNLQRQIIVNHDAKVADVRRRLDGHSGDVKIPNRAVLQPLRRSEPDQLRLRRVELESVAAHPFVYLGDTVRHSCYQTRAGRLRRVVVDLEVVGVGMSSESVFVSYVDTLPSEFFLSTYLIMCAVHLRNPSHAHRGAAGVEKTVGSK